MHANLLSQRTAQCSQVDMSTNDFIYILHIFMIISITVVGLLS